MPDDDQRPESLHGIHKPEVLHYIWYLDVGLHMFGSNIGPLALAPQETRL